MPRAIQHPPGKRAGGIRWAGARAKALMEAFLHRAQSVPAAVPRPVKI
ncbi:hypothetical protein SynRS9909_01587 [Synechococcus sp. RS9909]|nr:hypothetical protein SynRS9909_01587 [Synechococcus sp. RS9909]